MSRIGARAAWFGKPRRAIRIAVACTVVGLLPPILAAADASHSGTSPTAGAELAPLVTIQDLMLDEVDANSDPIWDAVGDVTTRQGLAARAPHTDAEWAQLRRHAVVLLEATNLLLIPGRAVAAKPFPSAGPGVFDSAQIQQRIDGNREGFNAHAIALRAIVAAELKAIDQHDAGSLQALGAGMDAACESCHLDNWYPHEVIPALPATPPTPAGLFKAHLKD